MQVVSDLIIFILVSNPLTINYKHVNCKCKEEQI